MVLISGADQVTYVLLPLPEASLLSLDLLSEFLPESLLFLLEFRIVELLDLGFAKLASLHLLLTVILIMDLLSSRNEIQHVSPDQEGP